MANLGRLLLKIDLDQKGSSKILYTLNQVIDSTKKVDDAGAKVARTFAGPVVQAFNQVKDIAVQIAKSSVAIGSEFEQSMQTVAAITGETSDVMTALENEVRRLGATTAFTAREAADAMGILARSGMEASELLRVTGEVLLFAGAAGTTLGRSAQLITATMRQFSLETTHSGEVTDIFSVALKESLFDMQSLTAAMRYGGSVASSFNMSLDETVASLALFRNLGLEGSMAGTQFRMAMSKASKETNRGTEAL